MTTFKPVVLAAALAAMLSGAHALAKEWPRPPVHEGSPGRPADPMANLPSATGAQTTIPGGAVTGAGNPQLESAASASEGLRGRAVAAELEAQARDQPHARDAAAAQGSTLDTGAAGEVGSESGAR